MVKDGSDPPRLTRTLKRALPFLGVGLLGLGIEVSAGIEAGSGAMIWVVAGLVVVAGGAAVNWERLPVWARVVPPIGFVFVVALLRDVSGASEAG